LPGIFFVLERRDGLDRLEGPGTSVAYQKQHKDQEELIEHTETEDSTPKRDTRAYERSIPKLKHSNEYETTNSSQNTKLHTVFGIFMVRSNPGIKQPSKENEQGGQGMRMN
jgi:hypothetical protein